AREHDALVAPARRMPLEAQKRAELAVAVARGNDFLHARPGVLQALEAVDPVALARAFHRGHVVPARMPGEREKIEMRARNLQRALDRPDAIAVRIVVVDVAEERPVGSCHALTPCRAACRRGACTRRSARWSSCRACADTAGRSESCPPCVPGPPSARPRACRGTPLPRCR